MRSITHCTWSPRFPRVAVEAWTERIKGGVQHALGHLTGHRVELCTPFSEVISHNACHCRFHVELRVLVVGIESLGSVVCDVTGTSTAINEALACSIE